MPRYARVPPLIIVLCLRKFVIKTVTTRFLLARHGQTQWNKLKKIQGRLDSPLTESGLSQAAALGRSLVDHGIDLIVSSPLPRALKTATIAREYLSCPLVENSDLVERHFGDWQGELYSNIEHTALFNEVFYEVTEQVPPNGESALAGAKRLKRALIDIATSHCQPNILVVCHGDILRGFLTLALNFDRPGQQYGNCNVITIDYYHQSGQFDMVEANNKMVAAGD